MPRSGLRLQGSHRRLQEALELPSSSLTASKGLKAAGRRVDALAAATNRAGDQARELVGGADGLPAPRFDDGPRHPPRPPLLAVLPQHPHQLILRGAVDEIARRRTAARHPHVERTAPREAEAPLGRVELQGRAAEIGEDCRHRRAAERVEHRGQLGEGALNELDPIGVWLQPLVRAFDSFRVTVEADEAQSGYRLEQGSSVPTQPDGGIDHEAWRRRREPGHHAVAQHGHVIG
jgi:hypothetical protein